MKSQTALEKPAGKMRDAALFQLGQITVTGRIGSALSSQAMSGLIEFEKADGHLALGFPRWVEFLESEYSPMTKHQYYDRKEVFEKENPDVWDRLTDMGVPINLRKRLPAGAFEIENDAIVIKAEDGTTQTLPLGEANRTQIIETVKILHESLLEKTKKIDKGQEDYRKLKEKFINAENESDAGRKLSALEKVHTVAIGGLAALAEELEKATEAECLKYADGQIALLASQFNRIHTLLSDKVGVDSIATLSLDGGDDDGNRLADLLDD